MEVEGDGNLMNLGVKINNAFFVSSIGEGGCAHCVGLQVQCFSAIFEPKMMLYA